MKFRPPSNSEPKVAPEESKVTVGSTKVPEPGGSSTELAVEVNSNPVPPSATAVCVAACVELPVKPVSALETELAAEAIDDAYSISSKATPVLGCRLQRIMTYFCD